MGNCQAAEAATVVIQHPEGKIERLYWPTPAAQVMKSNPGHHVALVTLCVAETKRESSGGDGGVGESRSVRFTRVRLLKPKDMLLVGQVYKLITSQEVNKTLRQRHEKIVKAQAELVKKKHRQQQLQLQQSTSSGRAGEEAQAADQTAVSQATRQERHGATRSAGAAAARHWRPSLQSIFEGTIGLNHHQV